MMARPRKIGVEREPNGRVSRVQKDLGTERMQLIRAVLAKGHDETLTATAMGVVHCWYRDNPYWPIERYHFDAAMRYQYVHNMMFGRPHATAQKLESCIGHAKAGDFSPGIEAKGDKAVAKIVSDYRTVQSAFADLDDKNLYESVVVYDHIPPWVGSEGALAMSFLKDFQSVAEKVAIALGYHGGGK
jgi:hypothetical protein